MSNGRVILVDQASKGLLLANPNYLFAIPDNLERTGFGTLAGECRAMPNAVSVPTMLSPIRHVFDDMIGCKLPDGPWSYSGPYGHIIYEICQAFVRLRDHLRAGGTLVWPKTGMVTAENRLHVTAPTLLLGIEAVKTRVFSESISISHESQPPK